MGDSVVVGICGNVYNWLSNGIVGNSICRTWESCTLAFPCAVNRVIHDSIACYAHFHNACLWVFGSEIPDHLLQRDSFWLLTSHKVSPHLCQSFQETVHL